LIHSFIDSYNKISSNPIIISTLYDTQIKEVNYILMMKYPNLLWQPCLCYNKLSMWCMIVSVQDFHFMKCMHLACCRKC